MVTFYKLQDTDEVRGFEQDPTFVGKSFEQSHIQYTHNPAWIGSMLCTGAVVSPSGYIYASGRIRNPQQTYVTKGTLR